MTIGKLSINLIDPYYNQIVLKFSDGDKIVSILQDRTRPCLERMQEIYDLADEVDKDPRISTLDNTDLFLEWPSSDDTEEGWQAETDRHLDDADLTDDE